MFKTQLLVFFLLITASAQAVPFSSEWNFQQEKISGKVKTIIFKHNSGEGKTVRKFDKNGKQIIQEEIDGEGKVKLKTVMKYDESNRLDQVSYFSQYKDDAPRYLEKAEYSENGQLKKIKRIQGENGYKSDNFSTEKIKYADGKLKEIKVKYEDKTVVFLYKFSPKGLLLETSRKDGNDAPKYVKNYTYDKKGNVKSTIIIKKGIKRFGTQISYLYDRSGNWIERTTTNIKYVDGCPEKSSSWTDYREIAYNY